MKCGLFCSLALYSCVAAAPTVELGVGESRFETLVDGSDQMLVAGPQGGHHVWVSFRGRDLPSEQAQLWLDVVRVGAVVPRRQATRVYFVEQNGQDELVGWPAIVEQPECLVGQVVEIRARFLFADGSEASDVGSVRLVGSNLGNCDH